MTSIQGGPDRSPLATGVVEGDQATLHCPSMGTRSTARQETRTRFSGAETTDPRGVYPNGISAACRSMCRTPWVRSIQGLERVHITRPGYAIEYDFFDPARSGVFATNPVASGPVLRRAD
ncbi:MAG: FAD-dependent oxidoreductase [Candidatus Competibacteraceae bacterium]